EREIALELSHALLQYHDVLRDLRQQDAALQPRHQELRRRLRPARRSHLATCLGLAQSCGQTEPPLHKHRSQPLAKSFVHVAELAGEVAPEAPADAIGLSLRLEHPVQEAEDLPQALGDGVGEARLQRALDEAADELVEDREAEVFLAPEVVVKVAFSDSTLPKHVVQRGVLIAAHVHEPRGSLDDRLPGGTAVAGTARGAWCLGGGHLLYQPVGTGRYAAVRTASSYALEEGAGDPQCRQHDGLRI